MNNQPPEKNKPLPDGRLDVFHIWSTIQGEGPLTGTPAVFIRLAGCNLSCPFCDTDYTSHREWMQIQDIVNRVWEEGNYKLVVITGGEPFRQDVGPLVELLLEEGYRVQIETNGTLYLYNLPYLKDALTIVCSPKISRIHSVLDQYVDAVKYLVKDGELNETDGLPKGLARLESNAEVFLQPLDEENEGANQQNIQAAVKSCLRFGYRLCLQVHKIVGLE